MTTEYEYKGYTIEIMQDCHPYNPREDDNLGTMVCKHSKYNLGDEQIGNYDTFEEYLKEEKNLSSKDVIFLPLYLYDHSGITMNTTGFGCRWDSSHVGYIFVEKQKIKEEYSVQRISKKLQEKVEAYLVGEVATYDQYLTGEIYAGSIIVAEKCIDSFCGHYDSDDLKQIMESRVDYLTETNLNYQI